MPSVTEKVKVPRAVSLEFPLGHPVGEPFDQEQQKMILLKTFHVLESIKEAGVIIELPYEWKAMDQERNKNNMDSINW